MLFNERDIIKNDYSTFEKIKKQIEFIKNTKDYISNLEIEYNSEGLRNRWQESFTFNFKPNTSNDFINGFVSLFADNGIFDIKWLGISSGHKAYLNLFASLHKELKKARQSHLLLCIDEGDLYLHPKWQIEFFDKLLNILPIIYSGKVQLILTSHSPFLLSDLPKQNITILDKGEEGLTLDGVKLSTNTFGGNLYNLYSEPFFLGNKRMSDFAYNKIKNLIDVAENKTFGEHERTELIKASKLIGDEIIKFRLKELLNDD